MQKPRTRLGALIRSSRQSSGLTQSELAKKVGCQRQAVSRFEIGTLSPSKDDLEAISMALKIPSTVLLEALRTGDLGAEAPVTPSGSRAPSIDTELLSRIELNGQRGLVGTEQSPASVLGLRTAHEMRTDESTVAANRESPDRTTTIVVAALAQTHDDNPNVAEVVSHNLERGVRYIYALPTDEAIADAISAVGEYGFERQFPDDYLIARADIAEVAESPRSLRDNAHLLGPLGNTAVIIDERKARKPTSGGPPLLRGFFLVQYPGMPTDFNTGLYAPLDHRQITDLMKLVERTRSALHD